MLSFSWILAGLSQTKHHQPESQTKQPRALAPTKRRAAWRREVGDPPSWVFASFFFSDLAGFLLGCRGGLRWLVGWFEVGRSGSRWGGVAGLAVGRGFGLRWVVYLGHCHNPIFFLVFFSRFSRSTWFLSVAGGSFDGFG